MDPVILKGRHVKHEEAPSRRLASAVASGEKQPPSVRTLVVDGVVKALELTCSCGEVTTIELKFTANPGDSP